MAWELETFAIIFFCGMVLLIEHQNYILCVGTTAGASFLVLICVVNEKINEKVCIGFIYTDNFN